MNGCAQGNNGVSRRGFVGGMGAAALAMLSSGLVACGGDSGTGSVGEDGYKDTLVVAAYGDQDTLDPQINVTNDKVLRLLYSGLLVVQEDGSIAGDLAETYDMSEDGLTWTFHLKEGVKFANGEDFTSADVVATFERLLNPDHPLRYTDTVAFIDKVEATDDYTVVMTMNTTYGAVEDTLAMQCCFIMCKSTLEEFGYDIGTDPETINGTGPYKVTSWDIDEQMTFAVNENWYLGEPGTPNIIMKVIPEASSRAMALENGEVDIVDRPAVDDVERLSSIEGLTLVSEPGYGLQGFQFNCSEYSKCQDVNVRKAISIAIDREAIVGSLFKEIGETPTHGPLVPMNRGYVDLGVPTRDVDAAKQLLAEAGVPDGFEMTIMTFDGYNKGVELAEAIKDQIADAGIIAEIVTVDSATFNATLNGLTPEEMKYDMFIMGFGGSSLDPDASLRRICVTSEDGLNTNNYGWYSNARVDELLNGAITLVDQEKRMEMYEEAQRIIYTEDPFAVYLNLRNSLFVMAEGVENFSLNPLQVPCFETIKVKA
ncbi:ABC transporter substrate-binding protein [Collinsella provencensis]|uniref:ABC transporter substrate-binding protein n=1 Tax=Collinsella provencensis TaxID=1937461 RepID=UPI00131D9842|nr:ABC transporter substrate-binding protein [Collinsella provencensis]